MPDAKHGPPLLPKDKGCCGELILRYSDRLSFRSQEPTSSFKMSSDTTPSARVETLRSLPIIRQQSSKVFDLAKNGKAQYFEYHPEKMSKVVDFCLDIIHRDFGTSFASIPPHGRWRHFDANGIPRVSHLLQSWSTAQPPLPGIEAARRLVDLFVVSVLLDAGAGTKWKYEEAKTGLKIGRSEGLAIASLDMFHSGLFATDEADHVVDAAGLKRLSPDALAMAMQVHPDDNPMDGLEGRAALLTRLGAALENDKQGYFSGPEGQKVPPHLRRPGFMIDYLLAHPSTKSLGPQGFSVSLPVLWEIVIKGFADIWPASRTTLDGVPLGDVWTCEALKESLAPGAPEEEGMVAFHKLSQWLTYSIMEPMEKILGWQFQEAEHMTGLPEYRNGGLFVDLGVLVPKAALLTGSGSASSIPRFSADHPAIIEWRALTVILLDQTADAIRKKAGLTPDQLGLKQVLEAATWKGGREIAQQKRPETNGGPPIAIESDGTVF
ncbi:unnamed protein product [Sympodiomycopsis kandeliae]